MPSAPRRRRVRRLAAASGLVLLGVTSYTASGAVTSIPLAGDTGKAIAIDDAGYAYVARYQGTSVARIRLSNPADVNNQWATVAGAAADMGIDAAGNVLIASAWYDSVSKVTPAGVTSGSAENNYMWAPTGNEPSRIAVTPAGDAYVSNRLDNTVTRIAASGISSGSAGNGYAWAQTGREPKGIAVDHAGTVYAAAYGSNGLTRISANGIPSGAAPDFKWAPTGFEPLSVLLDWDGDVFTLNPSGPSPSITRTTPAGDSFEWAALTSGTFPQALAIDSSGNLYTADFLTDTVTKIAPDGTKESMGATGDGPSDIAIDSAGNLYVTNYNAASVTRITPGGGTPSTAPAPPAVPSAPTASAGDGSATVTVTPNPVSSRYGAPTSYVVESGQDASKTCTVTVPASSCVVAGLTGGTSYTFTARARLNTWLTPPSATSAPVTPPLPSTPAAASPSTSKPSSSVGPAASQTTPQLRGVFRFNPLTRTGTTTGAVPKGATRITQAARAGGRTATEHAFATARVSSASGTCRVTKRKFTCTIRLRKGTWDVVTAARGKAGVVAQSTRRVVVR